MPRSSRKTPASARSPMSMDNTTLLVRLQDSFKTLADGLNEFVKNQREENSKLHSRIDTSTANAATQVSEIKDAIASRGRISGGTVLSLIAVASSFVALVGGLVHSYVSIRLENVSPRVEALVQRMDQNTVQIEKTREELVKARIEAAFHTGQTSARFEAISREKPAVPTLPPTP